LQYVVLQLAENGHGSLVRCRLWKALDWAGTDSVTTSRTGSWELNTQILQTWRTWPWKLVYLERNTNPRRRCIILMRIKTCLTTRRLPMCEGSSLKTFWAGEEEAIKSCPGSLPLQRESTCSIDIGFGARITRPQ